MGKIKFPIEVSGIKWEDSKTVEDGWFCKIGDIVCVRPCAEEFENKTYLGVFIGEIAQSIMVRHNLKTKELEVGHTMHNPGIFVPDINKIIYGYQSWWGNLESIEQLKEITDEDINNIWYVKALKQISEMKQQELSEGEN